MSYRCLVVDDEPLARELLTQFISQLPSLSLVASCPDALAGLNILHTQSIDILFTDIKMPQLSGIELVKTLLRPPKVILTTAFVEYAIEGFDVGAVDYLVKPFSFSRFVQAVHRALDRGGPAEPLSPAVDPPTFLFLKVDRSVTKVFLKDIVYLQAYGNYVKVFLVTGGPLLVSETMTRLVALLPASQFIRIHKSYNIALSALTEYQVHALSLGSINLPIGELYRRQFLEAVGG